MFNSHLAFGQQLQASLPPEMKLIDKMLLANKNNMTCGQTHNTPYPLKFSKMGDPEKIYIQALRLRGDFSLEARGERIILPMVGDFLTGARHEVLVPMISPDFTAIAGTSSWSSVFLENSGKEFPARYLFNIFVTPKWVQHNLRGQKLGSLLMRNMEAYAKEVGEKGVFLAASEKSRGFFEKMGYSVHRSFNLPGLISHTMVKRFGVFVGALLAAPLLIKAMLGGQNTKTPDLS